MFKKSAWLSSLPNYYLTILFFKPTYLCIIYADDLSFDVMYLQKKKVA